MQLHAGFKASNLGHPHNPYGARGGFSKPPLPQIWAQLQRDRNNIRFAPLPGGKKGERELVQMQLVELNRSRRWLANLFLG